MEVKLPSVYRDIYTLTGYRADISLRYYRTEMQRAVLPSFPPRPGTTDGEVSLDESRRTKRPPTVH